MGMSATKNNKLTAAQRRVMRAARRAAYTGSAIVALFNEAGELIGHARRSTCDELILLDLLTEDQSQINDDGRGDFEYVVRQKPNAGQLAALAAHSSIRSVGEIDCHGCGSGMEDDDVTVEDMAETAFAYGWRYGTRDDPNEPGVYCPDCQNVEGFRCVNSGYPRRHGETSNREGDGGAEDGRVAAGGKGEGAEVKRVPVSGRKQACRPCPR